MWKEPIRHITVFRYVCRHLRPNAISFDTHTKAYV